MEEKEFFCSWKASKFLDAASFANARKVNVSEFQVKKNFGGIIYFRFLIYLKAIYEQKMKEIDFSTLATKLHCKILVDFP